MLYWDSVATVVPRKYIQSPEMHSPYTLELIRAGLLHQVFPDDAGSSLGEHFETYLHRLSGPEIDRRRHNFTEGSVSRVHRDKWLAYAGGLREVEGLGLADLGDPTDPRNWILVETTTAAEFMAALALALCDTASVGGWRSSDQNGTENWVPTTDMPPAIHALLAGLGPVSDAFFDTGRVHMRVRGELRVAEVRTHFIERLLPVPETAVPPEELVRFRRTHGNLLPALRRYLESRIDESFKIPDPVLRFRFVDRIEDELLQRSKEAEAYLQELGLRRIGKSSLLRVLKFIPLLKDPIETAQDLAENLRTSRGIEAEPLAYLAFARATFAPQQTYRVNPSTGMPLIEAMS